MKWQTGTTRPFPLYFCRNGKDVSLNTNCEIRMGNSWFFSPAFLFLSFFFLSLVLKGNQQASGCSDYQWFIITEFPLVNSFQRRISAEDRTPWSSAFTLSKGGKVSGTGAGKLAPRAPPSLLRPVTGRKKDGRPQPELRKRWNGRQVEDFRLNKARSRWGRSPRRHTYPARSPRRPRPALPGPAASRALPARPSGRRRKSDPWSCPPRPTSRPHLFSPAGPPRGARCLFPRTHSHRLGSLHRLQRRSRSWLLGGREEGGTARARGGQWRHTSGLALEASSQAVPSRQPQGRPGFRFGCGPGEGFAAGSWSAPGWWRRVCVRACVCMYVCVLGRWETRNVCVCVCLCLSESLPSDPLGKPEVAL